MGNIGSVGLKRIYAGNIKIKQGYLGAQKVYSSGNIVTYKVDSSVTYAEEVDCDATCLAPSTFTPAKSGYTFVGWREDSTASGTILTDKTMGDDPITLYAVFRKTVTLTLYNGSTTATQKTGYQYYNNGNIVNPVFTVAQVALSGWMARGWSKATTGNGSIAYSSLNSTAFSTDTTLYGMYQQTITVTYYDSATTAKTTQGTRYYNSNGNVVNPSFTLNQSTKTGWTVRGWSTSSNAAGGISYQNGVAFATAGNLTLYGMYQQTITVTYYDSATTAKTTQGTRYYNSNGNVANPSFTLTQSAQTGWTARGWSTSNSATGSISYQNGVAFSAAANLTLYGMYYKTVTMTYNGNGSVGGSTATQSGTVYLCIYGTKIQPYTFTLASNGFTKTDYTFTKWAVGSVSGTQYGAGETYTTAASVTMYAVWKANSFYWIQDGTVQDGFPSTYATFSLNPSSIPDYYYSNSITGASVCGVQESNSDFVGETIAVATKGNKYIEVTMNNSNVGGNGTLNSFLIGGVECKAKVSANAVITVDVSSMDEVTLKLSMTAWAWGNWMRHYIKSIRFYS